MAEFWNVGDLSIEAQEKIADVISDVVSENVKEAISDYVKQGFFWTHDPDDGSHLLVCFSPADPLDELYGKTTLRDILWNAAEDDAKFQPLLDLYDKLMADGAECAEVPLNPDDGA